MVKEIFENLCRRNGVSPTSVCPHIGITVAAYSQWTSSTIPRNSTLQKIADYFGVSIDYLLGKEENNVNLPEDDKKMIDILHSLDKTGREKAEQYLELLSLQYGKSDEDEIDEIISALPDKDDDTVTMRIAAFGGGVHEVKVSKDDLRDIVNMLEEEEEN